MNGGDTYPGGAGQWPPLEDLSVLDDAAYEWLLSDHPRAAAERARRRHAHVRRELTIATDALAAAERLAHDPAASDNMRRLADKIVEPLARTAALAADVDDAASDASRVAAACRDLETARCNAGDVDYRYPAHLTGPAADHVPPPTADRGDEPR